MSKILLGMRNINAYVEICDAALTVILSIVTNAVQIKFTVRQ